MVYVVSSVMELLLHLSFRNICLTNFRRRTRRYPEYPLSGDASV